MSDSLPSQRPLSSKFAEIALSIKADEIEQGIADKYFVFEQTTASNVWTVIHNLQKKPSVSTVDSSGAVVYGFIEHLSDYELKITFKYPFAGTAYCN